MRFDTVLCLTPQTSLAMQVSRALAPLECRVEVAAQLDASVQPLRPWAVLLLDPAALPADWQSCLEAGADAGAGNMDSWASGSATPNSAARPEWLAIWQSWLQLPSAPVPIWLGPQPPPSGILQPLGILDAVNPVAGWGKLAYVVRQQIAASHWRRLSRRREGETEKRLTGVSARQQMCNPLLAIMGHAELALQSRSRMPGELRQRLEQIAAAAERLRDLLQAPPWAPLAP